MPGPHGSSPRRRAFKAGILRRQLRGRVGHCIHGRGWRPRSAVFVVGGLAHEPYPHEADMLHSASRVHMPVLVLNGHDFSWQSQGCQLSPYLLLGVAGADKRHVFFDTAHAVPRIPMISEVLDWLDRRVESSIIPWVRHTSVTDATRGSQHLSAIPVAGGDGPAQPNRAELHSARHSLKLRSSRWGLRSIGRPARPA